MTGTGVPVSVGWTPTATIGVIQTLLTVLLGGGGLYGIARGLALLWKMANESKKQDNDAAAALRREMAEHTERLNKRIQILEDEVRDERKRGDQEAAELRKAHAEEIASIRLSHSEEIRELRKQIDGLTRQMLANQEATGRAIRNGVNAPASAARMPGDTSGIGEVLRSTFDIPGTGDPL